MKREDSYENLLAEVTKEFWEKERKGENIHPNSIATSKSIQPHLNKHPPVNIDLDSVLACFFKQQEEKKGIPVPQDLEASKAGGVKRIREETALSDVEEDDENDVGDTEINATNKGAGEKRPQRTTALAVADYRNYLSVAAMHTVAVDIPPELIFSFSAVDFILLPDTTHCWVTVSQKDTFVPTWPVHTAIHAKHFVVHSAAGEIGPDIFLIKLDNISKTSEFKIFAVPHLTAGATDGYIVFGARCAGTTQIFTKILKEIVIPFIVEQQQKQLPGSDKRAYLMVDGEPNALLQSIMNNSEGIMELFLQHSITVAKVPALCAHTTQPIAVGKWVGDVAKLMSVRRADLKTCVVNEEIKKRVVAVLQEVNYWDRILDQMATAILQLSQCLERYQTREAIVQEFADAGVCPLDLHVIVNSCKSKQRFPERELAQLLTKIPAMAQFFQTDGVLDDIIMDELDIWVDAAARARREEKDVSVLFRQRGVILTHPSVIARFGGKGTLNLVHNVSTKDAPQPTKKRAKNSLQTPCSGNADAGIGSKTIHDVIDLT